MAIFEDSPAQLAIEPSIMVHVGLVAILRVQLAQ